MDSLLFFSIAEFATPWTVAYQVPTSMGFSRQEYWSGLPFPPLGDLPDPETEPPSLKSPALAGGFFYIQSIFDFLLVFLSEKLRKMSPALIFYFCSQSKCFPGGAVVKNPPVNEGDTRDAGSIPESGKSPGERNGNPLQYSCLENPMDR